MARLFVSYARRDMSVVAQLVSELREMGHEPFYDQDLTGGQRWWDVLLTRIEECDGFLPVLSDAYLDSEACRLEAKWASDVGVPILPLDLGGVASEMVDAHVAQTNWIRYGLEDRTSIARLARALGALPPRNPPDTAPVRPPVPVTYLTATRQEIHDADVMPVERQLAIIATLRTKLGTEDDASARTLLAELRRRPDVAYASAIEIDHVLGVSHPAPPGGAGGTPAGGDRPSRRFTVAAAAAAAVLVVALGTSWVVAHLGDDSDNGGGNPASGPGGGSSMSGSMSDSMSSSPVASSKTADLVATLEKVDANAKNAPLIPPGTCEVSGADTVHCEPGVSGVATLDFQLFGSIEDLYSAYMSKAEEVSGRPFDQLVNKPECDPKHFSGEVSWNHQKKHFTRYTVEQLMHGNLNDATEAAGRVFCWLDGTELTMVWTQNKKPGFLAVAEGAPHDDVMAWWRRVHHEIACLGAGMCEDMGDMTGSSSAEPSDAMSDSMSPGPGM
jgi:hypothetical protein